MNPRTGIALLVSVAGLVGVHAQQTAATTAAADSNVVELEEFEVSTLKTFSDQAIPGETPVAFSEVAKETIAAELGSRDIPLVLNTTPSVYATADSGGAGDARVNVRGFNQRNISILINGVPTNDIENGWLYWSNWDGLGDVTSTIQMQRGLSNVTLPTPSIGGTMNIITDPASSDAGGSFKAEIGSDSFVKGTLVFNTGLLKDKVAFTLGMVSKTGDGYADGTWTEGRGYYFGATILVNPRNRIEMFAIGAPQRHGQRSFASNIAAYDAGYARKLGYTEDQIAAAISRGPVDAGDEFNPNYSPVSSSYAGQQYYWGGLHNREDSKYINERENYFHKPQANLNWYSTLSDKAKLASVFYYSGGRGGGAGTLGSLLRYNTTTNPALNGNINWDATIDRNESNLQSDGTANSRGILRNSVNNQDQYGIISKLTYTASDALTFTGGVDWRTAEIHHFREVRDLLGGDYYLPTASQASEFWETGTSTRLGLGDKVDYYNTNNVDWLGLFLQGQYRSGPISAFAVYGYSTIDYSYVDHFRDDGSGNEFSLDSNNLDGHQIKGGVSYAFNEQLSAFVNAGWVSKAPIFDGAIDDVTGTLIDPINEKFTSFETGLRFETADRKFNVSTSLYYTRWRDRTITDVSEQGDDTIITYQRGVNSNYSGIEIEAAWQPMRKVRFDAAASFGDWYYTDDAPFDAVNLTTGESTATGELLYLKDLKVGDAPQSQIAYAVTVFPVDGLSIKFQGRWYDRYWADYAPETRTSSSDRGQAWEIPSYDIYDLHVSYRLPFAGSNLRTSLFLPVFNLFDETYVSDATDNSSFEGISGAPSHSAQRAEVFLGAPLTFNTGVRFDF